MAIYLLSSGGQGFNQNRQCPYFPCHQGIDPAIFNCKHCFCPLYFIYWTDCGGDFTLLDSGVKDCSACLLPHLPGGHEYILRKLREYLEAKVSSGPR